MKIASHLTARITAFFGNLRLRQLFVVVLAGALLLTSVACSPSTVAAGTGSQKPNSGTSSYNDYDAGQATTETEDKAKMLVERAKRNVNRVDDLDDVIDEARNTTPPNPAEDAGEVITDATNRLKQNAKEGFRNLQKNVDRAGDNLEDATQTAKQNAERTGRNVQRGAEDVADYAKDKAS
ncbi:hypothetical protein IFO70_02125 [Phormidium tenue FACHB-886]|nr:hypothetical protein [Phormidium tenue FACHB-886]